MKAQNTILIFRPLYTTRSRVCFYLNSTTRNTNKDQWCILKVHIVAERKKIKKSEIEWIFNQMVSQAYYRDTVQPILSVWWKSKVFRATAGRTTWNNPHGLHNCTRNSNSNQKTNIRILFSIINIKTKLKIPFI